jgi:hypothetical protein
MSVIPLKPLPANAIEWDDRRLGTHMLAYWFGINAGRQNQWPMPPEFAERIRVATVGLESH